MHMNIEQYCHYDSPIGQILLAGTQDQLLLLGLPQGKLKRVVNEKWRYNEQPFKACIQQLTEYFAGKRKNFDLNYRISGTEFQQRVLRYVAKIPYGTTVAYSAIAAQIKQPNAVRAVGGANANNPLPIIIPCHRVIGKNGTLTGFGGGLSTKEQLLRLEGALDYTLTVTY